MAKLILRSFWCLLLWIVILSRAFGIAMVMIHAIVIDIIGVTPDPAEMKRCFLAG